MNKIGGYLQEHISGEVSLSRDVRERASRDASVLKIKPEMVIYPKHTNDIRKIARFVWQLAERGHTLPMTARGLGSDNTGAAIGSGVILSLPTHMNRILEFDPKQRLVRLQPGITEQTLATALLLQGVRVPALSNDPYSTVGGAVASNSRSVLSGKYGAAGEWVDKLEVVLANGEVIQTGRISKKDLNKKKGLGTLEGEIYRSLDNLIEDNKETIEALVQREIGTSAGYTGIASVKRKDGSFDLTSLILGSQGTLGIISEMILKVDIVPQGLGVIVASFADQETAGDASEVIIDKIKPTFLESFDAALFEQSTMLGKSHSFLKETGFDVSSVLVIGFEDSSERARSKNIKKTLRLLSAAEAWTTSADGAAADELLSLRDALLWTNSSDGVEFGIPSVLGGAYIPPEGVSVFRSEVKTLAKKHSIALSIFGQDLQNVYYVVPKLSMKKSGDKQKMLKLLDDYARMVQKISGELVGSGAEGRLRGRFALGTFDDASLKLFADIKAAFDPYKLLNPGVKELLEIKQLVPMIQSDDSFPSLPGYVPRV